jgi:hypothetical protein
MKVGDKVNRFCETYQGKLLHIRPYVITRITKAGYVYAKPEGSQGNILEMKFNAEHEGKFREWRCKSAGYLQFRIWLERPST